MTFWPGRVLTDPIRNVHEETLKASHEVDRAVPQYEPVDVMGGGRREVVEHKLRRAILDIEFEQDAAPILGDDYQLEYDEDGYPKLPACLDRRA